MATVQEVDEQIAYLLRQPNTSFWLKGALAGALGRGPDEAADEAEVLAILLSERRAAIRTLEAEQSRARYPFRVVRS